MVGPLLFPLHFDAAEDTSLIQLGKGVLTLVWAALRADFAWGSFWKKTFVRIGGVGQSGILVAELLCSDLIEVRALFSDSLIYLLLPSFLALGLPLVAKMLWLA